MKKLLLIIGREYFERVRNKSFIIVTLLMPIIMIAIMAAPTLMMLYGGKSEQKRVMVVDRSGMVVDKLYSSPEVEFVDVSELTKSEACAQYGAESDAFGVLYIGSVVDARDSVQLITNSSSSMMLEENISGQISAIVEQEKLLSYNIENLDEILASVETHINLSTFVNDGTGAEENMESTSSSMNYILGLILGMLLYMIIIIYGQMVLTSVVEEKASRVIDVMVTSATPFQLMMGKILGIAAVAVTQIAIWAILVISASKFLLPALMPADAAMSGDAMLSAVLSTIGDAGYLATIFAYMLLFRRDHNAAANTETILLIALYSRQCSGNCATLRFYRITLAIRIENNNLGKALCRLWLCNIYKLGTARACLSLKLPLLVCICLVKYRYEVIGCPNSFALLIELNTAILLKRGNQSLWQSNSHILCHIGRTRRCK